MTAFGVFFIVLTVVLMFRAAQQGDITFKFLGVDFKISDLYLITLSIGTTLILVPSLLPLLIDEGELFLPLVQ